MALKLGSTSIGSLYLGSTKIGEAYLGSVKVYASAAPIAPYTIRLQFSSGVTPTFSSGTAVQVSSSPNVWDLTYNSSDWTGLLSQQTSLIAVLGGNTSSVTKMGNMFQGCSSLTTIQVFDTSSVTEMSSMCGYCSSLTAVPLFNTSSVQSMGYMFAECRNVASGAYALYQQASSQTPQPYYYSACFQNCGAGTVTGAAELAQIPSGWK